MCKLSFIFISVFLISASLIADENQKFKINIFIDKTPYEQSEAGSGGFIAEADEYGRISLLFYGAPGGIAVLAAGTNAPTVHFLHNPNIKFTDNISAIIDLYLKAGYDNAGSIVIDGVINKLININLTGEPLFKYSEESISIDLSEDNGNKLIVPTTEPNRHAVLRVEASEYNPDHPSHKFPETTKRKDSDLILKANYSLYNQSEESFVIRDAECDLTYFADSNGQICENKHIFELENGDRILYWSTYDIEKAATDEYGIVSITFLVTRLYAVNPDPSDADKSGASIYSYTRLDESLKALDKATKTGKTDLFYAEKIVSTSFGKAINIRPGEKTEIEIPPDKETPLPFKLSEFIVLTNIPPFVEVDETPEMIYSETPVYPVKAKKDGVEALVWVKAYVDKEGEVRNAYSLKCNMPGYGFEEASIQAAYANRFKPARQNKQPVAIWISYSVTFTLSDEDK